MNSYLVTIDPPKDVADIVNRYRNMCMLYTNYKIPPHTTIYPPFYIKVNESEILESISSCLQDTKSFNVTFNSISYFEGSNNVAFFAPDYDSCLLIKKVFVSVVKALLTKTEDVYDDYKLSVSDFIPHMTVVERIPDNDFERIKNELCGVVENLSFIVRFICLYKQEADSSLWRLVEKVKLL